MTMITADDRATNPNAAPASSSQAIPRCVCGWKNCRVYQKAFREGHHPFWDGVIKLRFVQGDAESMALKAAIDRQLKVESAKRNDFKNFKGAEVCRYTIARHHFTQKHIQKYLSSDHYSFIKPFTLQGAQKYLYAIDERDTLQNDKGETFYVQVPNNSKETVKAHFQQLKENLEQQSQGSSNHEIDANTVATERSNLLVKKEAENAKLKEQLEAMQSQLTFLHDMVKKLQEDHLDNKSVSNRSSKQQQQQQPRFQRGSSAHSRSRRTMSSRSGRSGVPREIELGDDEVGSQYDPEWSEHYEEDGSTVATFHASYRAQRRSSIGDQSVAQSVVSRTSRAASIVSASKSVKSLPREIELDEDEDDSESHESLQEEAWENRSTASNWRGTASVHDAADDDDEDVNAEKYDYGPTAMGSGRNSVGPNSRKPTRRSSLDHTGQQRRSSLSSHLAKGTDGSIVSAKSNVDNQTDISSLTAGTYQVQALVVTDPYGEQGIYTGTISASTNMPHGYGRLEYDRAGRWYEGDWKHGRWTGKGRLSNGDGDFYEGGLKNDHKHGFGVMKFADGRIFEGDYVNGQMIQGTMTYQDGSTYTGSWVDGMRHGKGRCVFTDQSVYEGEFKEGEFFGHGKMTWSDGGWYEGAWVYGEMDGFGKEVRPDGSLRHEGEWRKGQPNRK